MSNKNIFRTAIGLIIALMLGFGIHFYYKLSSTERKREVNLYELVPAGATAVLETTNLAGLINDFGTLPPFNDYPLFRISRLLAHMQQNFDRLLSFTPHGLSNQMNKVLISFHSPDYAENQVVYFPLGVGDMEMIGQFIRNMSAEEFPPKQTFYKGETIWVYPLRDNSFLSCYITNDYVTVSFRKKLIEEVIDARSGENSLLSDTTFMAIRQNSKAHTQTVLYTRMDTTYLGPDNDMDRAVADLGDWCEYVLRISGNKLYLSGIFFDHDSINTFHDVVRQQRIITDFPDCEIPLQTYYFAQKSLSHIDGLKHYVRLPEKITSLDGDEQLDLLLQSFLDLQAGSHFCTVVFASPDTLKSQRKVNILPLTDVQMMRRELRNTLYRESLNRYGRVLPLRKTSVINQAEYVFYPFPVNQVFPSLFYLTPSQTFYWMAIYKNQLLVSDDYEDIITYIREREYGRTVSSDLFFEEYYKEVTAPYQFLMLADLEMILEEPEESLFSIPSFFYRHQEFFRNFIMVQQIEDTDDLLYSNLVLIYKGE